MTSGRPHAGPDIAFAFAAGLFCLLLFQSSIFTQYCGGTLRFGDLAVFEYLPVSTWMLIGLQTAVVIPAVAAWVFRDRREIAAPALGQVFLLLFQIGIEAAFAFGGDIHRIAVVGAVFSTWRALRLVQLGRRTAGSSPVWAWVFFGCALQWALNLCLLLAVLWHNCATP